jgi:ribonuclease HI
VRSTMQAPRIVHCLDDPLSRLSARLRSVHLCENAAFDSVSHHFLDMALGEAGASDKSRAIFRAIYTKASAMVRVKTTGGEKVFSSTFPVRRGVVQGDIFSPLCFIVALEAIFRRHDCKTGDGIRLPCKNAKNGYITVAQLAYADDTDLLCKDCEEASRRTTSISAGGRADADMHAHKVKTEAMIHEQCVKIDTPTEEDIIAEKFEHACEYCARSFSTYAGLRMHQARWCGEAETETFEEEFKVKSILDTCGPPERRFYLVNWAGHNDTGKIVRGDHKRQGQDTAPGERWAATWEPAHHLSDAPIEVDAFWEKNPLIDRTDTIIDATVWRCQWCCQVCKNETGLKIHQRTCRSKPGSRNGSKTQVKTERRQQARLVENKEKIFIEGTALPACFTFPYLGHQFQADGNADYDIEVRMARARSVFGSMRHIWNNSDIPERLKIQLYKAGVCSVLTYAHETWTLNEATCRRLNGWNCRCLVKITGKEYREEATTPTFDLVTALRARRLRWLGHILRMPEERLIRQVALRQGTPATNKAIPAGGLFMDAPEHSTVPELLAIAGDREKWRAFVNKLAKGEELEDEDEEAQKEYCWEVSRSLVKKMNKKVNEAKETAQQLAKLDDDAVVFYTDGGCDGNGANGVWGKAGWGAVAMRTNASTGEREVADELWGNVELDATSPYFLGATVGSNNTGELIGIAQALIWLRDVDAGQAQAAICFDSEYAARITQGIYRPKKNAELSRICQRLLKEEAKRRAGGVKFIHVRGHSDDVGNDRADLLVQWGKEEGPYSRLREAEPETAVEAKERRVVWRERLRKEEEKIEEEERESERVGAERDRDKLGRMANVNVSVEIECECRIVRGVNEEGEEFELRLGMCDLDVARGGLMVGPPAGSMSCEHNEL